MARSKLPEDIEQRLLALAPADRLALATRLLASVEGPDPDRDDAWSQRTHSEGLEARLAAQEARLALIELNNRRLRLGFVAFALAAVACGGVTALYEQVSVQRLIIVDGNEKQLAKFVSTPRGAELSLLRADGSWHTVLDASGTPTRAQTTR